MRNKLIGLAVGLAIAAGIAFMQSMGRNQPSWELLPENEEAISAVAFQYTRDSAAYSRPCLSAFLRQIDASVQITVVCGDEDDKRALLRDVRHWGIARPGRVRTIVVGEPITGWCKDRFLVGRSSKTLLVHPPARETGLEARTHDARVAPAIAGSYPSRFAHFEVPMDFDAGDIVATEDSIIISDTLQRKNPKVRDLDALLERMFGKRVIHLRGVPNHHIGMFAAPLDERIVLVGSPKLAQPLWTEKMDRQLGRADFSENVQSMFDRTAEQLGKNGFRVVRIPAAYLGPQTYITYTNGVFETRGRKKIVYMPVYNEKSLDGAARSVYVRLGWEVRAVPVRTVYQFRGTIGCLVNVLERN